MGIRQFDTVMPADAERSSTHRAGAPEPQVTRPTGQDLLTAGIPAPGRATEPRTQARALALASGGRLARAGQALLQLRRQHGNRHVQQVVEHAFRTATAAPLIQTKLMVGAAGDRYEREADRVAEEVARGRSRRTAGQNASSDGLVVQRSARAKGGAVDPEVQQGIQQARAGGRTISEHVRAPIERALGADLRGVRLHTDDTADWLNRALGARGFTTGKDVFLRRGEYRPDSYSTRRLLAHELTHVVQQDPSVSRRGGEHDAYQGPNQAAEGGMIQCLFPARPHAGDLAEINRIEGKPADTAHLHQGITSQPSNYVAPRYRINVEKKGKKYIAKVEATGAANMGDCEATYLGSGAYDTGLRWGTDPLYDPLPVRGRLRSIFQYQGQAPDPEHVIETVSASVARGSKAAEQEHLNDNRYAYGLTLGAAEEAIEAVAGRPFRGATSSQARASAKTALQDELTARSNDNVTSLNRASWAAKYAELARRSGTIRDGGDYHLQDVVENRSWNTGLAKTLSRKRWGFPVHHVDVEPGPKFRLGIPSRYVIDPNANREPPVPKGAALPELPDMDEDNG
jgi:hypothetical protein